MGRKSGLARVVRLASISLVAMALAQEWSKPEPERTWEGTVLGFVPYSFRPPTYQRIRQAWWNADDPRLLTPRVFGVGWAVNLYRGVEILGRGYSSLLGWVRHQGE